MRLIGTLLLVLLLAVLATFAYDRRADYLPRLIAAASGGPVVHDQRASDPDAALPSPHGPLATIPYGTPEDWTGLSGLQAFGRARFPLPRAVGITGGELVVELTSELEEGAVARLRLNVNGSKRGEIVVESGITEHRVLLPLRAEDFLAEDVQLTLATEGVAPAVVCRPHWDGGVVIRLRPTSHLRLALGAPLSDPGDLLVAGGMPARVLWPETGDAAQRAALLRLAANRPGIAFIAAADAREGDLALTTDEATRLADRHWAAADLPADWPVPLERLNANLRLRDLDADTSWRIPYDRRLLPGEGAPDALTLGLRIAAQAPEDWLLTVTQDGRLLHGESLRGQRLDITRNVRLPALVGDAPTGTIDVTLRREGDNDDQCREPIPAVGELTAASVLRGAPDPEFMGGIHAGLGDVAALRADPALTAREAMIASATLRETFPRGTLRLESDDPAQEGIVTVLPTEALVERAAAAMTLAQDHGRHWLVWLDRDANGALLPVVVPARTATGLPPAGRAALLISLP